MRGDLLENEDMEIIRALHKCPIMHFTVQNIKKKALIDTGSEVTCISETFYGYNFEGFRKCEFLPIVGINIVGATEAKPVKLKHQVYANLKMGNWGGAYVFFIAPKLNKECIIAVDLLKRLRRKIDFNENTIELKDNFG